MMLLEILAKLMFMCRFLRVKLLPPKELTGKGGRGELTQDNSGMSFDPSIASRSPGHTEMGHWGISRGSPWIV